MTTPSSEELLEAATKGESIDSKDWPAVLDTVLERLENTLKNTFPIPRIPEPDPPPPPLFSLSTSTRPDDEPPNSQTSTATDKENAPPRNSSVTPTPRPPVPSFSAISQDVTPATQPTQQDTEMTGSESPLSLIPTQVLDLYEYIRQTLRASFGRDPPHTLQRLAELILYPTQHYRFLPSYLRALDRVVCVSSPAKIFPLPAATIPVGQGVLNGTTATPPPIAKESLGSDESLGGALLTPIPWLRPDRNSFGSGESGDTSPTQSQGGSQGGNELKSEDMEMVDGPNGVGRIETVSVINGVMVKTTSSPEEATAKSGALGAQNAQNLQAEDAQGAASTPTVEESLREAGAVTQGELLRLEQEAGVVPVSVASRSPARNKSAAASSTANAASVTGDTSGNGADAEGGDASGEQGEAEEERPHARGPEEIGDEDIGPQNAASPPGVLDMEKAVGRSLSQVMEEESEKDVTMGEDSIPKAESIEESINPTETKTDTTIGEPGRTEGKPEDSTTD